jgi:hypothetical protein
MTVQDIAKLQNVDAISVRKWIATGKLTATFRPIGNGLKRITRLSRDDYERFLEDRKDQNCPPRPQ